MFVLTVLTTEMKSCESWGRNPTADEIAEKSAWRDDRLAALVVHKREQKSYD